MMTLRGGISEFNREKLANIFLQGLFLVSWPLTLLFSFLLFLSLCGVSIPFLFIALAVPLAITMLVALSGCLLFYLGNFENIQNFLKSYVNNLYGNKNVLFNVIKAIFGMGGGFGIGFGCLFLVAAVFSSSPLFPLASLIFCLGALAVAVSFFMHYRQRKTVEKQDLSKEVNEHPGFEDVTDSYDSKSCLRYFPSFLFSRKTSAINPENEEIEMQVIEEGDYPITVVPGKELSSSV